LAYQWNDDDSQIILDQQDANINQIYDFIEDAVFKVESILVVSTKGQSRCSTVIAAYLMKKYKWNLLKTLEYLNSRRPDLEIRTCFIQQLSQYETKLATLGIGCKTTRWDEVYEKSNEYENEELLLRNTFMNSQMGPIADFNFKAGKEAKTKIEFKDPQNIATVIDVIDSKQMQSPIDSHKKLIKLTPIIRLCKKLVSRNYKLENERSFGRKSDISTKTISNKPPKQVKMLRQETPQRIVETKNEEAQNVSPMLNCNDLEPKANDPYKRIIFLNSHKNTIEPEKKPTKINNFVLTESKPMQSTSPFMNMLKMGTQNKHELKQEPASITNIIQSPNINNYIILNQPSIQVVNNNPVYNKINAKLESKPKENTKDQKRPSSCKPKEDNKKDKVPFPKNPLTNSYKYAEAVKTDQSNAYPNKKKQATTHLLGSYRNGPVK